MHASECCALPGYDYFNILTYLPCLLLRSPAGHDLQLAVGSEGHARILIIASLGYLDATARGTVALSGAAHCKC